MLIYLGGFFIVAIVWEGREVAYGQRLFIGLLFPLNVHTLLDNNFKKNEY